MKRIGLLLSILVLFVEVFAQVSAGRSATTTMFNDFKPGVRTTKEAIGRKKRGELEHIVAYDFSWSSEASLIRLFPLFR